MTSISKLTGLKILSLLLLLIFSFSCKKKKTDPPTPTTGTIVGKVTPTNGAVNVVATPTSSGTTLVMSVSGTGDFKAENVTPGDYTITANPSTGYGQPAAIQKNVTAGNTADVGTIQMTTASTSGNVTFTLDGTNYNIVPPFAFAGYNSPNFIVGSQTAAGNVDHISVSVTLNNVNGPGTFVLGSTLNSTVRILQYVGSTIYAWSTVRGGSGTVNITTLNTVTRTCSGTFTVNAVAENNFTTGTKTIANGTFTNLIY